MHPPVADAGAAQTGTVAQLVQLAGTCTDIDNDATMPTWSFTSKPAASASVLSSTGVLNPSFMPDAAGNYVLQLICNDGKADSAPSTVTITVTVAAPAMSLSLLDTGLVGVGRAADVRITLSAPAPAGGLVVTLTSDDPSILAVATPSVTVPATTQASGTVSGLQAGNTTLRASAAGFAQGSLGIGTPNVLVVGGPLSVPLAGTATLPITITTGAPAGGLLVTLTTTDANVVGVATPTITIAAGQTSGSATVQGVTLGSASILAQAQGYASGSAMVTTIIPATLTVTSLADSGPGSLRDAVAQANLGAGPNTIVFAPGSSGPIVLTTGQIQISDALTIVGPGAADLTIDGNANNRIFAINDSNPPACPALRGRRLRRIDLGAHADQRAPEHRQRRRCDRLTHSLLLQGMVIRANVAKSGGGVKLNLQYLGQSLTIAESQFIDNIATPLSAIPTSLSDNGGALAINENCDGARTTPASVTIANSVFTGNRVQPVELPGFGGAIATFSRADITITDSRIVDNHLVVPNPPVAGAFYAGGGIYGTAKSLTILRREIAGQRRGNLPADNTAGYAGGIGIYNDAADLQAPAAATTVLLAIDGVRNPRTRPAAPAGPRRRCRCLSPHIAGCGAGGKLRALHNLTGESSVTSHLGRRPGVKGSGDGAENDRWLCEATPRIGDRDVGAGERHGYAESWQLAGCTRLPVNRNSQ